MSTLETDSALRVWGVPLLPSDRLLDPFLLVSDEFGAQNPDIAVDGNGIIYIVFETLQSDLEMAQILEKSMQVTTPISNKKPMESEKS